MKTPPKKTAKSFPSGPGFDRPVRITGKDRRVSTLLPTVEALGVAWPLRNGLITAYVDSSADWLIGLGYNADDATADDCPPEAPEAPEVAVVKLPPNRILDLAERLAERHPVEVIALYSSLQEAWSVQGGDVAYDSLPIGQAMAAVVARPQFEALGTEWVCDGDAAVVYMHVFGRDAHSVVAGCKNWRGWGYDARPVDPRLAMDGTSLVKDAQYEKSHVVRVTVPVSRWEEFARGVSRISSGDDATIWPSFEEAREYEQGAGDWDSTPQAKALETMKPSEDS